jgi:hypothetical protein
LLKTRFLPRNAEDLCHLCENRQSLLRWSRAPGRLRSGERGRATEQGEGRERGAKRMQQSKKYKVCLWSGGKRVETWMSKTRPQQLEKGGGYRFTDRDGLVVEIMGTVSIEEGDWEYEELGPQI